MPYLETNGIKMFYEEQGSGDPLLLIMGITAPGAVWEAHAEAWQANFRCILGDNRGVGQSDKPTTAVHFQGGGRRNSIRKKSPSRR